MKEQEYLLQPNAEDPIEQMALLPQLDCVMTC